MDDYAMIREIVRRRYSRLLEEGKRLPDLILIDGGKGHMAAGVDELEKMGIGDIPAIGIAKQFEHVYLKGRPGPIVLPRESKALHLLQRVRDEAHRFAILYHKNLRTRMLRLSGLDEIKGIGTKRKKALINYFGTVDRIKAAGIDELLKVEGMNEKSAQDIIGHFKKQ
ncbi:MAG: helix-hairpin-helix domain-containing protein, partial [Candidatus Omnitrophota bacterium]|nr:helix-hairpin-helix domain-containing protein [Candidatus Omnitrophota bacterium]